MYHVGETIYLLLLQHEKLPPHCFLAEKEDGTGRPGGVEWGCCVQVHLSVLLSRALPLLLPLQLALNAVGFIASNHLEDVSVPGLVA